MQLIDCKSIREEVIQEVKSQVDKLDSVPKIAIVQVEGDEASNTYVKNKLKTAELVGIDCEHIVLPSDISQEELNNTIMKLNFDNTIHGLMLQLPIPKHLSEEEANGYIGQHKDLDGLTSTNMGMLMQNHEEAIIPATANAVYHIIKSKFGEDLSGLNVTVVNRSKLIGQPLQALLTNHNATVTLCHSKTSNLHSHMIKSDILVTGIGKAQHFNINDCSDEYQLIIDCGINYVDGKLVGDWNEDSLVDKCDDTVHLTPVGKKRQGVGSITTACLMKSAIKCYEIQKKREKE